MAGAFPGTRRALARYLGYYHSFFRAFSWDGYVMCALACIHECEGRVFVKTIERPRDSREDVRYLSKYKGLVTMLENRIFVIEFESLARDAIVETILYPAQRSRVALLRGVTLGVSSKRREPYASRVVWKYLGRTIDRRAALGAVGLYKADSRHVDRRVLSLLGEQVFPSERLRVEK